VIRVSFGIIVLNGQPFLERNLQAIYPFAHEIIVVEGATKAARNLARPDGHSSDGTLEMLEDFKNKRDPDRKLHLISAADEGYADGFWPEKDEMSQAYVRQITGDWLWQVDSDEFYKPEDMSSLLEQLEQSQISAVSFPYLEFFGSFTSVLDGVWYRYEHPRIHRLFRWESGYSYQTHRPPTVLDEQGRDLREKSWMPDPKNDKKQIRMFHYSYVLPKQARQKVGYYSNVDWTDAFRENDKWLERSYLSLKRPMFLSEKGWPTLQWLDRYSEAHPSVIEELRADLRTGRVSEPQRPTQDIEKLLRSPFYSFEKSMARLFLAVYWPLRTVWKRLRNLLFGQRASTASRNL
jgi:hypothetical protein